MELNQRQTELLLHSRWDVNEKSTLKTEVDVIILDGTYGYDQFRLKFISQLL